MFRSFLLACTAVLLLTAFFETTSGLTKKGNEHFDNKRYESALEVYRKAQVRDPDRPEIRYNLGTSLYQLDQFQEAESQLEGALGKANTQDLKSHAWYNYGNAQYRLGRYDAAIDAYRKTLDLDPKDADAKYNLEFLQKKKAMFEKKQDQRDQEKKQQHKQRNQQRQQGGSGQEDQTSRAQGRDDENEPEPTSQDQQEKDKQSGQQGDERRTQDQKQDIQSGFQEPHEEPTGSEQAGREDEQSKPEAQEGTDRFHPLRQGQMSREDAMRILEALRESEQELQVLRQTTRQSDHEPEKDW